MHQLALQDLSPDSVQKGAICEKHLENVCALCKRPFTAGDVGFEDQGYFKLLAELVSKDATGETSKEEAWCYKNLPETAFNQGYFARFFKQGRKLGRGAFGSVFLCQHIIDNVPLGEYAVKIVPIGDEREWLLRHLREVHALERLRHPNIIEYKHTWIEYHRPTKFGPAVPCLFILMEYANGGNLEDLVNLECIDSENGKAKRGKQKKDPEPLDEDFILRIFLSAARGLHHLHSLGILHRDMKPANLLLSYPRDSATHPNLLISDFGECTEQDASRAARTGATGTIEFMAPELFQTDKDGDYTHEHSFKTDIWSLGMILYYLCLGRLPYKNVEDVDELQEEMASMMNIHIPEESESMSPPLRQLLENMLNIDWNKRAALKDIIKAVETILLIKASPPGPTFQSPNLRAITSSPKSVESKVEAQKHRLLDCTKVGSIVSLSSCIFLFFGCYPCFPSITVAVVAMFTSGAVLTGRFQSLHGPLAFLTFTLALSSLRYKMCAC